MTKKVLVLEKKKNDTINSVDIYDAYNDFHLSRKEREEKLIQGIQSTNHLKARADYNHGK